MSIHSKLFVASQQEGRCGHASHNGDQKIRQPKALRYLHRRSTAGTEVQVVDANTGEDLTSVTLRLRMHDPHCSPLAVQAELDTTVPNALR
jgi:hypothetical protein